MENKTFPGLIYGTAWKKEQTDEYVKTALSLGFCGIDTACQPRHYREDLVGKAVMESGIPRERLFVQTKYTPPGGQNSNTIPYDPNAPIQDQILQSFEVSRKNLKTDYLDSLLLHSPLSTLQDTMEAWRALERLVENGVVKHIGISNCYEPPIFKKIYESARIKPSFLQNRFYAESGYDRELRSFCNAQGVIYQSFWTLTANPHILSSMELFAIAREHRRTTPEIFFRYCTQKNIVPLIGATTKEHLLEDLSIFEFALNGSEIEQIDRILQ